MKTLTTVVCLLLTATLGIAQNHFWTIPPNYSLDGFIEPLPSAPPGYGYAGEISDFAHNAIASTTGEIEFFIVDGVIYDRDGYLISEMWVNEGAPGAPHMVTGNSEVCIVPDPGNCFRYYIFSNRTHGQYPVGAYTILDMELPNTYPGNEDRLGALVFGEWDDGDNCEFILDLDFPDGTGGTLLETDNQNVFYAATDENEFNERFVFVQIGDAIRKLVIDESGIYADSTLFVSMFDLFPEYGDASWNIYRHELEVIQLQNGNYRLGFTYAAVASQAQSIHVVAVLEFDINGQYIENSAFIYPLSSVGGDRPIVKGLEFSPNGRYLYFSHHEVSSSQPAIQYIDYEMQQVFDLNVPNRTLFQYSQIETGIDGKLYFAYENGLAALDSADTPNEIFWIPTALTFNNQPTYSGFAPQEEYKAYTLPDQIDGMDYSLYPYYPHNTVNVSAIETWTPNDNPLSNDTSLVRIKEELRFTAGSNITIKNMRFEFYEDARVVIEPGAWLTLDSTTFTIGPCHAKMWLGVEVWGDPQAAQLPYSNQGYLRMQNNSVIEHAYIGALASRRDLNTGFTDSPGGVIRAYNSRFRNNQRDVYIRDYTWTSGAGNIVPNYCYFENCDFLTDSSLNHTDITPWIHTHLDRVNDVYFRNCSWRNTASFQDLEIEHRGIGILSFASTFRITGQNETYQATYDFLPISSNAYQCFYRLHTGAVVWGLENHHFTISKMEFQLNKRGMVVFGVSKENITFNNFEIPTVDANYNGGIGAYLQNTYLFTIEENHFFSHENLFNTGLIVDNSNKDASQTHFEVDNEVYRNTFDKLNIGISVVNNNRGAKTNTGLEARCNQFSRANGADIFLTANSVWRDNQGSGFAIELLTNNVFSYPQYLSSLPYRDVRVHEDYGVLTNNPNLMFDYNCLDDVVTKPVYDYLNPIPIGQNHMVVESSPSGGIYNGISLDYENHCPINFTSSGGEKYPLAESLQKQATAENNLQSAIAVYKATIDGGETEDVMDILLNIHGEESAYLRDLLLSRYPLSRRALMAALEAAESFDPWHLTQVLVANSKLPGEVYRFLVTHQVLSPFFMQFIDDAQQNGGVNLGRLLFAEISHRSYEKSSTERDIHRHFLYHTDSVDYGAWNAYLQNRTEPHYILHRIGDHLDKGETGTAQTLLDSVAIHQDRKDWVQFMIDIAAADTATAADFNTGWDFFYNKPLTLGDAWGWLYANGATDSLPGQPVIVENRSFTLANHHDKAKPERFLQAWPNPAKDRVVLTYPREADGMGLVQIFNADGRLVNEFTASDAGFQEINLNGWPTGLYIAKLIVNGKDFETVKISVVK